MKQLSLVGAEKRYRELDALGDALLILQKSVKWELFREPMERALGREKLLPGEKRMGRPSFDAVLMFKVLVVQHLFNLSDAKTEYLITDRLSFMRFLGLGLEDPVPDEKTIWLYREALAKGKNLKVFLKRYEKMLKKKGLKLSKGKIVDASVVEVRTTQMSDDERDEVLDDEIPEEWEDNSNMLRQKDLDARFCRSRFGYKNHIVADEKTKLILDFTVHPANLNESQVFECFAKGAEIIYADAGYDTLKNRACLARQGIKDGIIRQARNHRALSKKEEKLNRSLSKVRKRIEHIFGYQAVAMGQRIIRTVGLARATVKIGLRNLCYNIMRTLQLERIRAPLMG